MRRAPGSKSFISLVWHLLPASLGLDINMIESRTLLQIFESKLEETARLFFTNSFITVDLVTLIYNIVFWGLAIPAVIYLL